MLQVLPHIVQDSRRLAIFQVVEAELGRRLVVLVVAEQPREQGRSGRVAGRILFVEGRRGMVVETKILKNYGGIGLLLVYNGVE